jgi:hypothetical protein
MDIKVARAQEIKAVRAVGDEVKALAALTLELTGSQASFKAQLDRIESLLSELASKPAADKNTTANTAANRARG